MCYTWKLAGESSLLGSQKLSVFHNKTTTTTTTTMQIKMRNNVKSYRSLQVMRVRHLLNKSDKKEQLHRVLHSDNLNQRLLSAIGVKEYPS